MDQLTKELLYSLSTRKQSMVEQLTQFCAINSYTENLHGLLRMRQTLEAAFAPLSSQIKVLQFSGIQTINGAEETVIQPCGDALFISKRPELKQRILLCGHMDTVYSEHHSFQNIRWLDDNTLNGPGVIDMKGGLLIILQALTCFEQYPAAANLGWDVFINADEEIGSPASAPFLKQIAKNYQAALVYEPAITPEGTFAKNRRGSGKFTLIARGKAAHVGRAFAEGRNAICYLAEVITAIHALNGRLPGITINVGQIAGGEALNVVPDKAVAKLDIRIDKPEDEFWVKEQLNFILEKSAREGYSLMIDGGFNRPVKRISAETEHLFSRVQQAGKALGLAIDWQDTGGCCDGNNLAALGLPVIDTLGVCGGLIHSSDEYLIVDSLVERVALSTLLLLDLANGGL